jgi:threonine/homoserine efflux transporter RhtA
MSRIAIIVAAAAGLAAAAATDGLLAAAGAARVVGLEVGVAAAPLLVLAVFAPVRRELAGNGWTMLVVLGASWTLAPLIDEHATRAVVMGGALPDLLHHLAGWPALIGGARLGKPVLTS